MINHWHAEFICMVIKMEEFDFLFLIFFKFNITSNVRSEKKNCAQNSQYFLKTLVKDYSEFIQTGFYKPK